MTGIGIDLVDLNRLDINNKHFVSRILSNEELVIFNQLPHDRRKLEYLGGRFAAKEAYLKACHKGLGEIPFKDISILNDEFGAPYINKEHTMISITHESHYAMAFVIIDE